jgi:hypothetical protein
VSCVHTPAITQSKGHTELFGLAHYERKVKQLGIGSLPGPPKRFHIGYPPLNDEVRPETWVEVSVVDYPSQFEPPSRNLVKIGYYGSRWIHAVIPALAICPDGLPSVDDLIQSYNISADNSAMKSGPFSGLQKAVGKFTEHYCNLDADLPLVSSFKP